jgi:hypothetical protein
MQVVYHLGAPCTDDDMLLTSLLKNRRQLAAEDIMVPPPTRYRTVLRDASRALKGAPASEDIQEALLDAIIEDEPCARLVLSNPHFICINRLVVQGAQIWPMIERETLKLRNLFPEADVSFCIAMRDPGSLIPALFTASRFTDFEEFTQGVQPRAVRWSEMLTRLTIGHPDCGVTVWCNEDTPLIWSRVMRALAGCPDDMALQGTEDLLEKIMDPVGFRRMQTYLADHPPESETQRSRITAAFLDKFALEEAIEEEIEVPGWSEEMLAEITASYEADIEVIAEMPNVRLIAP